MAAPISTQERRNLEQWLEESQARRQLIEQQVELINGMLVAQAEFSTALQENAAAFAKALPK